MADYALYIICFLSGALASWFVGFSEYRLSPAHRAAVGAAKKAAAEVVKPVAAGHKEAIAIHEGRLRAVERKVLGHEG